MSMIGTMLLRAALLSEGQVTSARALSMEHRIPLVDALLDLGLMDEDAIVAFFHSKLMIPRARPAILGRVGTAVLSSIPAKLAWRHFALPISRDTANNLTVAMLDPTDIQAIDEIAAHTGSYLVRAVAPSAALKEALAKHYGPRPKSETDAPPDPLDPGETQPAMRTADMTEPDMTEPGSPLDPEETQPAMRTSGVAEPDAPITSSAPGEPLAVPSADATPRPRSLTPSSWNPPLTTHAGEPPPLSPEAFACILPHLVATIDKDEVTRLLLDFLGGGFDRVLLFVNSRGELRGHDARGADLLADAVKQVRIPISQPSVFSESIEKARPYLGRMPQRHPVDLAFAAAFDGLSGNILCLPIPVGNRVPLLLFAQGSRHPIDPRSIHELTQGASAALQRIIAAQRSARGPS